MSRLYAALADLMDQPLAVSEAFARVVESGRLRAETLGAHLASLQAMGLVSVLFARPANGPVRAWVYPSDLGLQLFATLERDAERIIGE